MSNFQNSDYEKIISDLIHDSVYIDSSIRGKIQKNRQYSEIIVRRIIDVKHEKHLTLGQKDVVEKLENEDPRIANIVKDLKILGNNATHTQYTDDFVEEDLDKANDCLFELFAYLFIQYFRKFPINIDTKPEVLHDFSLLPPVIRYKTLKQLFIEDPINIYIHDKLSLAIVKCENQAAAYKWIMENEILLKSIPYPDDEQKEIFIRELGEVCGQLAIQSLPYSNSYELCSHKIKEVGALLDERGKMYERFEQAVLYFKNYKSISDSKEMAELHDIMDFVYIGRKSM